MEAVFLFGGVGGALWFAWHQDVLFLSLLVVELRLAHFPSTLLSPPYLFPTSPHFLDHFSPLPDYDGGPHVEGQKGGGRHAREGLHAPQRACRERGALWRE